MSVEINQVSDREIHVNGKEVKERMDGCWVTDEELTPSEDKAFKMFLNAI